MTKLTNNEVLALQNFDYQIGNGGMEQYMGNRYLEREWYDLLGGLKAIGLETLRLRLKNTTVYYDCGHGCSDCDWGDEGCDGESGSLSDHYEDKYLGKNEISFDGWDDYVFYKSKECKELAEFLGDDQISKQYSRALDEMRKDQ